MTLIAEKIDYGQFIYRLICDLYPLNRSLMGPDFRLSLSTLLSHIKHTEVLTYPSGQKVFDWQVPLEWSCTEAYLLDPKQDLVCSFAENNLSLVGYSVSFEGILSLDQLRPHLFYSEIRPDATPYVTSYYHHSWGFCLPYTKYKKLKPGTYYASIKTDLQPGYLSLGVSRIPGKSKKTVFLSSYLCHPSLVNNELSGPCLLIAILHWLETQATHNLSYMASIGPETIGSLALMSSELTHLKNNVIAGFNLTCVGDAREFSMLPSRNGNSMADRVLEHVLHHQNSTYIKYTWLDRGSDERQYCSPGADLPVASFMRSKYGTYPEYHTSDDDLSITSPEALQDSFTVIKNCISILENNFSISSAFIGEPQLGRRNLYPNISTGAINYGRLYTDILTYSDGSSLLQIAEYLGVFALDLLPPLLELRNHGLVHFSETPCLVT